MSDIQTIRARARQHIEEGAVTPGYGADHGTVVKLLNEALATEIVCNLRYRRHDFMASGIHGQSVAAEFREHANEEQEHADQIARGIVPLGGEPNFAPEGLTTRSHAEFVEGESLTDMIKGDLVAERIAIDAYREIVNYLSNNDPTTRRLMETILATVRYRACLRRRCRVRLEGHGIGVATRGRRGEGEVSIRRSNREIVGAV